MAKFEAFSDARGWYSIDVTDEKGTLNRAVTPSTIGAEKIRAIGSGGEMAEWVGSHWLGIPQGDADAQFIADSINAVNIIYSGENGR